MNRTNQLFTLQKLFLEQLRLTIQLQRKITRLQSLLKKVT